MDIFQLCRYISSLTHSVIDQINKYDFEMYMAGNMSGNEYTEGAIKVYTTF